ncbi:hypothetical protein PAXRUDRAFT_34467 [Paxillus rubicundulus Ve08.2h10]|uniref:Protein kinase domain-containing protein n=1 Tax=Paxillus rubicundulus Ve08.2h10 TaxID=930991 RepID=A0A0D0E560_9AGAM|nr:hypothetical protein PAXRUDRAFT_34467 [Paxillus rubicundulus Ve08.2h10]
MISSLRQIAQIVEEFGGLSDNDKETCFALSETRRFFAIQGLVAYTFTHLIFFIPPTKDDWSRHLPPLKVMVQRWAEFGDTTRVVSEVQPGGHKCNTQLLDGMMLLKHDVLDLAAVAALCVKGPERNPTWALLEKDLDLKDWHQQCFFDADFISRDGGGFGVVYSGNLGSRMVAVKVLKQDCHSSVYDLNEPLCKVAVVWRHVRHPNCLPFYGLCPYVIRGLNYLHSMQPHMAHGDLKPHFHCRGGRACLPYVGLKSESTFTGRTQLETVAGWLLMGRTLNYMAPELQVMQGERPDFLKHAKLRREPLESGPL